MSKGPNWLLLGGIAIGGYFLYQKFFGGSGGLSPATAAASKSGTMTMPPLDLRATPLTYQWQWRSGKQVCVDTRTNKDVGEASCAHVNRWTNKLL